MTRLRHEQQTQNRRETLRSKGKTNKGYPYQVNEKAPLKTGLGDEAPNIVSLTYRNSIDIKVAGGATLAFSALLKVIPECTKAMAEARSASNYGPYWLIFNL